MASAVDAVVEALKVCVAQLLTAGSLLDVALTEISHEPSRTLFSRADSHCWHFWNRACGRSHNTAAMELKTVISFLYRCPRVVTGTSEASDAIFSDAVESGVTSHDATLPHTHRILHSARSYPGKAWCFRTKKICLHGKSKLVCVWQEQEHEVAFTWPNEMEPSPLSTIRPLIDVDFLYCSATRCQANCDRCRSYWHSTTSVVVVLTF